MLARTACRFGILVQCSSGIGAKFRSQLRSGTRDALGSFQSASIASGLRFFSESPGGQSHSEENESKPSDEGSSSSSSSKAGGSTSGRTEKRTYYDVLEVSRKASKDDIKNSYRRLAKKYHPDKNVDDPEAEHRFKEIQEAHATLSDSWKKALYDQDLQFSKFGTAAAQEVEREAWTEHWDRETPEEREARKERYKRYAAGERNDLPPVDIVQRYMNHLMVLGVFVIFYVCIKAPDWFDAQNEPGFCDKAVDDRSVPLVRAFHDPVLNRWERIDQGKEPPCPSDLYAHYQKVNPALLETIDLQLLPKKQLTVMMIPKTEVVKSLSRVGP